MLTTLMAGVGSRQNDIERVLSQVVEFVFEWGCFDQR
jgi:hypothetical protein